MPLVDKEERRIYNRQHYEKNKESILEQKKEYNKKYYVANSEVLKETARQWAKDNPERVREKREQWQRDNPQKKLHNNAKHRAVKYGLEFSISPEDILLPTHCPIMGVEFTNVIGSGRNNPYNYSLDRIDSSKGYTKDNIQVISDIANIMKNNATKEQLILFAKGVLKLYG